MVPLTSLQDNFVHFILFVDLKIHSRFQDFEEQKEMRIYYENAIKK